MLTERENAQMSWCKVCKTYSLVYYTCAISFTQKEIEQFADLLDNLRAHDFSYDFYGKRQAIIKNHQTYIGICLTEERVHELKEIIQEALAVDEIFKIIYES
ncbi:MAG: DUF6686 family protein [Bacteroidota bacterium]